MGCEFINKCSAKNRTADSVRLVHDNISPSCCGDDYYICKDCNGQFCRQCDYGNYCDDCGEHCSDCKDYTQVCYDCNANSCGECSFMYFCSECCECYCEKCRTFPVIKEPYTTESINSKTNKKIYTIHGSEHICSECYKS